MAKSRARPARPTSAPRPRTHPSAAPAPGDAWQRLGNRKAGYHGGCEARAKERDEERVAKRRQERHERGLLTKWGPRVPPPACAPLRVTKRMRAKAPPPTAGEAAATNASAPAAASLRDASAPIPAVCSGQLEPAAAEAVGGFIAIAHAEAARADAARAIAEARAETAESDAAAFRAAEDAERRRRIAAEARADDAEARAEALAMANVAALRPRAPPPMRD